MEMSLSIFFISRELSFAVIGVGALGGFVCELLSRQGITRLKIVDGDKLQVGNLSRHILTKWKCRCLYFSSLHNNESILLNKSIF